MGEKLSKGYSIHDIRASLIRKNRGRDYGDKGKPWMIRCESLLEPGEPGIGSDA